MACSTAGHPSLEQAPVACDSPRVETRVLVQFVHPDRRASRACRAVYDALSDLPGVRVRDLYALYPDFDIDVEAEHALVDAHGCIVFVHPIYWYAAPALLKEWFDTVLTHGWAYGSKGRACAGKQWLSVVTTGAGPDAYTAGGKHGRPLEDFLRPFEHTARFCRMEWLPPMVQHGARQLDKDARAAFGARVRARVEDIRGPAPAEPAERG